MAQRIISRARVRLLIRYVPSKILIAQHIDRDQAKKEALTDGVKRALRNFGNLLGLCLYEKQFTQEVVKIKAQPVSLCISSR